MLSDYLIFDLECIIISFLNIAENDCILELYKNYTKEKQEKLQKIWIKHTKQTSKKTMYEMFKYHTEFLVNNTLHSLNDKPCVISAMSKEWRKNGLLHRDGLPAIEHDCNIKEYYKNGKRHRDNNLPAVETLFGLEWLKEGKLIKKQRKNLY